MDKFTQAKLVEFIKFNEVKPAVNLIQANPLHQRTDDHVAMAQRDVQMVAWQSFSGGDQNLFETPVLKEIAAKYEKSVAQVILRWLFQLRIVVIPKSSNPDAWRKIWLSLTLSWTVRTWTPSRAWIKAAALPCQKVQMPLSAC